jgi:hypothetical protein
MSNSLHPLKAEYNEYVRRQYGAKAYGDPKPFETEIIATRVLKLGLDYAGFVEVACTLWQTFATKQGMKYPAWNLIKSNKTFERIAELYQVVEPAFADDSAVQYECELLFASQYLAWLDHKQLDKPQRQFDAPIDLRIKAAQQICKLHGIPFISSNYNCIYRQIHDNRS